jgi:gluconokinase
VALIMGVSGAGKTTVGQALAARLGWRFVEGDALHPPENIAKMASGAPLEDADRWPWLARVAACIQQSLERGSPLVMACSALKASYRERLQVGDPRVLLVSLEGSPALIAERLRGRVGHFMPPSLLPSQLATLELPREALRVDIARSVEQQVDAIVRALGRDQEC